MKASIQHLLDQNPTGLMEMKPSMSVAQYRENGGFNLQKTAKIYESSRSHHSGQNWFAFPGQNSLEDLFRVSLESNGDLLVIYLVETIKAGQVYCYLILSDEAYRNILNDKSQHVLKVKQMYSRFFTDHVALNMMAIR